MPLVNDKPDYCAESGCPLAMCRHCGEPPKMHDPATGRCPSVPGDPIGPKTFEAKGKGFVLGSGDPYSSKYMFILEAPGKQDISFFLFPVADRNFFRTPEECNAEIARRRKAYVDVPEKMLRKGAPMTGDNGVELEMWVLPSVGIARKDVFIDHTLRCLPPKEKGSERAYPTGDDRKQAEQCCRHWDRLHQFRPDAMVITMHPAGILREVTPLPLQVKDFEKARDFHAAGHRVALLIGGMSAKAYLRYGENVTKFRGDYRLLPKDYIANYKENFKFVSKGEKKRKAKIVNAAEGLFDLTPGIALSRPKKTKKVKEPKKPKATKEMKTDDGSGGGGTGDSSGGTAKRVSRKRTRGSTGVSKEVGTPEVGV